MKRRRRWNLERKFEFDPGEKIIQFKKSTRIFETVANIIFTYIFVFQGTYARII